MDATLSNKCPCCELVIDEQKQAHHVERCHPELLQKRWQEMNMAPEDILAHFIAISDSHPPLEAIIDDALRFFENINLTMNDTGVVVHARHRDGRVFDGHGQTLMAALCLAMDRVEYAHGRS